MRAIRTIVEVLAVMSIMQSAHAARPTSDEMLTARQWASSVFDGKVAGSPASCIDVLNNHGCVQKNSRYGRPLKIGITECKHGLFCHAPSKVLVKLPAPGKTFTAVIGVDERLQTDNRDFASGPIWPEIIFSVHANGKELFKSEPMKNAMPGKPIGVDLGGAKEFTIQVSGAERVGQSIDYTLTDKEKRAAQKAKTFEVDDWGEADWADASVALDDGRSMRLDELTLPGNVAPAAQNLRPFSFKYGGKSSSELLDSWKCERSSKRLDDSRTERTLIYTDPKTELQVRCVGVEYRDFPTIEWTLHFKNTGNSDTPIIEDIQSLDMRLTGDPTTEFVLHHSVGSGCMAYDFRPIDTPLTPSSKQRFAPVTGYSSDPVMPYFNVELPSGEGVILAVGWPGQWAAEFVRDGDLGLSVRAGQQTTHFRLHPGEEVRSPLIALQFYRGEWIRSQNVWRRWMIEHNMPKPGGKPIGPILAASAFGPCNYFGIDEQNQKMFIDRYREEKIGINWWWMDLGWHTRSSDAAKKDAWEPCKERFPKGLGPVTDYGRSTGIKSILWFAPEHSPFGAKPELLIKGIATEPLPRGQEVSVLNLGNPEAVKWLVETVDKVIANDRLDCYRHDVSWGPLPCWQAQDAEDRQGITENHYVTGFLSFYDELLRRHPNLMIDNCCRGGRRNDLETMRRAICLWRSDYFVEPVSQQCQTYGLSLWLPFFGIGTVDVDTYMFRSNMTPSTLLCYDMKRTDLDYNLVRKLTNEWWQVAPNYFGDFYPLTPYNVENNGWMAWQFNSPEAGTGMLQVFRRTGTSGESITYDAAYLKLRDLDPESTYEVTNFDEPSPVEMTGLALTEKGVLVKMEKPGSAALVAYKRK